MLNRQRIVLDLVSQVNRPLNSTVFVKLMFLIRHETLLRDEHTFYDFVPYKFGPFSFLLYRERASLARDCFLMEIGQRIACNPDRRNDIARERDLLPEEVRRSVARISRQYGGVSPRKLLQDVYTRYPWFATRSELAGIARAPRETPSAASPAVYTVGYEEKSVDGFFQGLLRSGIRNIVDVRYNPISRKYGFSKKSLCDVAEKLGFSYHHFPMLGISGEERRDINRSQDYLHLFERYEKMYLPSRGVAIGEVAEIMKRTPSALLCMEKDPQCCHRSRLAKHVSRISDLPIIHLQ